jgi:hypothetical protein
VGAPDAARAEADLQEFMRREPTTFRETRGAASEHEPSDAGKD